MVLGEVVAGFAAMHKLLDAELKARTAFRIGKLTAELEPHVESFDKLRSELLEKFGTVDKDAEEEGAYKFKNGEFEKFSKEVMSLLEEKVDVKVRKLKLSELDKAKLTGRELMSVDWLIADK